jgi:hypothetical protein
MNLFVQLFDSALTMTMDTQSFLNQYFQLILLSDQVPDHAINRFMVKSVTLNKHTFSISQHEYLTIKISDAYQESPDTYLLFLERTPFSIQLDTSYFTTHPDSRRVFDAVAPSPSTLPLNPNELYEDLPLLDTSSSSPLLPPPELWMQRRWHPLKPYITPAKSFSNPRWFPPSDQFLVGQRSRITPGNAISFDSSCTAIAFLPCATSTILIPYLTVGFFPALNVHRYFSGFLSNRFSEYFLIITCNVRLLRFSLGLLQ